MKTRISVEACAAKIKALWATMRVAGAALRATKRIATIFHRQMWSQKKDHPGAGTLESRCGPNGLSSVLTHSRKKLAPRRLLRYPTASCANASALQNAVSPPEHHHPGIVLRPSWDAGTPSGEQLKQAATQVRCQLSPSASFVEQALRAARWGCCVWGVVAASPVLRPRSSVRPHQ